MFFLTDHEFEMIRKLIFEESGILFKEEKMYYLESKLYRIIMEYGLGSFTELAETLQANKEETLIEDIIDAVTIKETYWFRDQVLTEVMNEVLMPKWIAELKSKSKDKIRIWSMAASTGQEAYSVAILIQEYLETHRVLGVTLENFEMFGTDISKSAIELATDANYDAISMKRGMFDELKKKYFHSHSYGAELIDDIARIATFKRFNLLNDYSNFGKFDFILCRHVLIYFQTHTKKETYEKIWQSLNDDGVFLLGASEIYLDYQGLYTRETLKTGAYFNKKER